MNVLEIAIFNIESALAAQKAGANRLELCENPYDGGTTPSYGFLKRAKELISLPMHPIVRPRGGDFMYSNTEWQQMQYDLQLVRDLGYPGAVMGLLLPDGNIDIDRTAALVELVPELEITFHRAFDRAFCPLQAVEDIVATGCKRILTSAQVPNVANGIPLLQKIIAQADKRIIILPGSGIRSNNIQTMMEETGLSEFHSSARKMVDSAMEFTVDTMEENLQNVFVDAHEITQMHEILRQKQLIR